jgi:hypothetical protein
MRVSTAAGFNVGATVPCFVYLRADPNPIHCNELPDEVLQRVEATAPDQFVQLASTPYGHDDAVRTGYARAGDIAAILPMHPRELEAELDDPPDWYQH